MPGWPHRDVLCLRVQGGFGTNHRLPTPSPTTSALEAAYLGRQARPFSPRSRRRAALPRRFRNALLSTTRHQGFSFRLRACSLLVVAVLQPFAPRPHLDQEQEVAVSSDRLEVVPWSRPTVVQFAGRGLDAPAFGETNDVISSSCRGVRGAPRQAVPLRVS